MARVLVPLAPGFEEIEAVTIIDVLRRAEIDVTVAGLMPGPVTGSHGISIETDADLEAVIDEDYDLIALPGGLPGADHLEDHIPLRERLQGQIARGGQVAAICAAPKVLAAAGLLEGRNATSYPGFLDADQLQYLEAPVVSEDEITTSRGPATALRFALTLVERLAGSEQREMLEEKMLIKQHPTI